MKSVKYIIFILLYTDINAQNFNTDFKRSLQLDIGISRHGTGDMGGYNINTEFRKYFREKLAYTIGIGATIHDGTFPYGNLDSIGGIRDLTFRYAAGGIQLSSKFGYSVLKNKKNEAGIQTGLLLRYQTSSFYDQVTFLNPIITGLTEPVLIIVNESPQRTVSIGGILQIFYNHKIGSNSFVGSSVGLQTDTNGDTITQLALSFGIGF